MSTSPTPETTPPRSTTEALINAIEQHFRGLMADRPDIQTAIAVLLFNNESGPDSRPLYVAVAAKPMTLDESYRVLVGLDCATLHARQQHDIYVQQMCRRVLEKQSNGDRPTEQRPGS